MARTYRKVVKCGVCTGSNTEYYRDRARKVRNTNRHNLRNLMANYDIETVDEMITDFRLPHDSWNEPTDGTFCVSKKSKYDFTHELDGTETKNKHYGTGENYWNHKFGKYLKNKHK